MEGNPVRSELPQASDSSARLFALFIALFISLSYSIYLFMSEARINSLGDEDGFFEYLTAFFFLAASVFFLKAFLKGRNKWFALLSILFFLGFGEEVSWGQRIFNLAVPEYFQENNVQGELTLHNLEAFNSKDFSDNPKVGVEKLITVNFLYNLFWLGFGVLLPLAVITIPFIRRIVVAISLPVPPFALGMFFLLNWFTFRVIRTMFLQEGHSAQYYDTIGEIHECGSSLIFFLMAVSFYKLVTLRTGVRETFVKAQSVGTPLRPASGAIETPVNN